MRWVRRLPLLAWMMIPVCLPYRTTQHSSVLRQLHQCRDNCTQNEISCPKKGYQEITGPEKVHGFVGKSLCLSCHYLKRYEKNIKYWCKVSLLYCSEEAASESKEEIERISIKDNRKKHYFQVTINNLTMEDSGIYRCAIAINLDFDSSHTVEVIISSAPAPDSEERLSTTVEPDPDLSASEMSKFNISPTPPMEPDVHILIYCISVLAVLVLLAAVITFVLLKKRRGSQLQRKEGITLSDMVPAHNTEDSHNEVTITDHTLDNDGAGLYSNVQVHPKKNNEEIHLEEVSERRDDVYYATLLISDVHKENTYSGIDLSQAPAPEVVYEKVKDS